MGEFQLKKYLETNVAFIRIAGLWPKKDYAAEKFYLLYGIILNVFFIHVVNLGITIYAMSTKSLEEFTGCGYFIFGLMSSAKIGILFKYNKTFKNLLDAEIFKVVNVTLNLYQQNILHESLSSWKKLQMAYVYIGSVDLVAFVLWPIFENKPYNLPMLILYPFDYKKPVIYQIVYFHQTVGALGNLLVIYCGATLMCAFLAYTAAECEVLVDMLRNMDGKNEESINMGNSLLQCIKYHKEIIKYSRKVETYFSIYLLVQFIASCSATALMMTYLSLSSGVKGNFLFILSMQVGAMADLFIYCWYGEKVTSKSGKLPYAAFETNWVDASSKFKKDLLFFMHRVQNPITIYAVNFFTLNINTFTNILRTALSYYTVLKQLSNEE